MSVKSELLEIQSKAHLNEFQKNHSSFYLLFFYSSQSQSSIAALKSLKALVEENTDVPIAAVNAFNIKDIHPQYNVNSVPTVIAIKNGHQSKRLEGKQSKSVYDALLHDAPQKRADGTEVPPVRITVYSTPTCPHCTTVKSYLRKHRFHFSEVDVSRDTHAAEELMSRSGSMGVPQTDVNGTLVVGADMTRLNQLLGIR